MVKIHFIGIGGSGISGIAKLAKLSGYEVDGCDVQKDTAYTQNIFEGHSKDHVVGADLVVTSPALFFSDKTNPEIELAREQNKLLTWQEFLGTYLQKNKKVICVAGTHGKSTTTAMAAKLLEDNGFDPSVTIGAVIKSTGNNYRFGKGKYFVTEADEFFNNFLNYNPEVIVLNNIEFDHPDFFKSKEDVYESFRKFVKRLTGAKVLIANAGDPGVLEILKDIGNDVKVLSYSDDDGLNIPNLKVPGVHNKMNAKGIFMLGRLLKIDDKKIAESLAGFEGIARRLEIVNEGGKFKVFDDYAHHPTAIKETLKALRSMFPKNRIIAVDEPHGFARSSKLLTEYSGVFDNADISFIGPIFKARDTESFGMNPGVVAQASKNANVKGFNSFPEILDEVKKIIKKGDVVCVMGAGDSYKWAREISKIDTN